MEGLQGAVLEVKLRHLDDWNAARRAHAARYNELLAGVPELTLPTAVNAEGHVWHLYVVMLGGVDRKSLMAQLAERGVATAIHYPTLVPFQPAFAHLGYRHGAFPVAEDIAGRCLSLPMYAELTDAQIQHVVQSLKECLATSRAAQTRSVPAPMAFPLTHAGHIHTHLSK